MGTKKAPNDSVNVKGMFRMQITEDDGTVVGDSGWKTNLITNAGYENFLVKALASQAGSSQVGYVGIGTGTAPASNATALDQELTYQAGTKRMAVTYASSTDSRKAIFTATFGSSNSFVGAGGATLQNIGLFASSSAGTLFAGTTYATSACASNQNVNVTYQIAFS